VPIRLPVARQGEEHAHSVLEKTIKKEAKAEHKVRRHQPSRLARDTAMIFGLTILTPFLFAARPCAAQGAECEAGSRAGRRGDRTREAA